jgi:hypothetical protein
VGSGGVVRGRNGRIRKGRGVRELFKPAVPGFRRRLILTNKPPQDLVAPTVVTILLSAGVVQPPFGRLDFGWLVDVKRAPYHSLASRFFAANSNTRVPPLIHQYPLATTHSRRQMPHPPNGTVS